jgi:RNA polymerase sigma-70 factor (ECF subfamily)
MGDSALQAAAGDVIAYGPTEIVRLVARAVTRDAEAFGELYLIYIDRIYRYVFSYLRDKMTAQDLAEEAFLKAWTAIESCKGKEGTFSAWLYRIAHNHVIDHFRRRRRYPTTEPLKDISSDADDIERELEAKLEQQRLLEAISRLPQSQKRVIILKFIEGLDNCEIAGILGTSEGNVRIMQMRALTALRQMIDREKQGQ